ncbi:glycosyltransferase [Empedobacter falsenii]
MINLPKVSVVTITYGQEKYIAKCIEGVLMQEGNFELEFIIGFDNSPDKTAEIIESYIQNHPKGSSIKFINREKNIGMVKNFADTLSRATGGFIAICDGDDYWTDPLKLSKQINFLSANKDFSLYFHRSEDEKNKIIQNIEVKEYTHPEILNNWFIHTSSIMFPNILKPKDLDLLGCDQVHFPDIILFLILANKGKVWGTNESMSKYTFNENSVTNSKKNIVYYEKLFNHLNLISTIYDGKYAKYNKDRVKNQSYKLFRYFALKFNTKAFKYLFYYLKN